MTFPACAGVSSPINPSQALRLCQGCALYVYSADGIKPMARRAGGESWACINHVSSGSSLTVAKQSLAGSGTDTGAGFSLREA